MSNPAAEPQAIKTAHPPAERFLLLDGLRGVAAFAVILDHVPSGGLGELVPGRALSVDFFFVLSGFVLAHAYGQKLEGGWSPWAFMRARWIRLYPLYLAGMLIGIAFAIVITIRGWPNAPSPAQLLTVGVLAMILLPQPPFLSYAGGGLYPFNGPAWSLFFELLANAVYALVARFLSLRVLVIGLPFVAILFAVSIFNHPEVRGPGWRWEHFDAGLSRVLFGFFAGVMIYKLRAHARLPFIPWWAALPFFLTVIAMPVSAGWAPAYDVFAAIVLLPLLVALASGAPVSGLVAKVCAVFGLLSYGVYVMHEPLYQTLWALLMAFDMQLPDSVFAPLMVALMAASFAALANRFYDRPFRAWLSNVLPGGDRSKKLRAVPRQNG